MPPRHRWISPHVAVAILAAAGTLASGQGTRDATPAADRVVRPGLAVEVKDAASGRAIPCRLTIVDERGSPAQVRVRTPSKLAVRPGVVYTPDGRAEIEVAPGRYTLYASRGFAFGVDRHGMRLKFEGRSDDAEGAAKREVG